MRLVLDNVEQGFATIDRAGRMSTGARPRAGPLVRHARVGTTLFDYLAQAAPAFAEDSRAAWEQVIDGFLPLELTLAQMPQAFAAGGREYRVAYGRSGTTTRPSASCGRHGRDGRGGAGAGRARATRVDADVRTAPPGPRGVPGLLRRGLGDGRPRRGPW